MYPYIIKPETPRWDRVTRFDWSQLPARARNWLLSSTSTSVLIEQACGVPPNIDIVHQGWLRAHPGEALTLGIRRTELSWIREVKIIARKKHWMLARTVFPRSTLRYCAQPRIIGKEPIGQILFKDNSTERSHFEIAQLYGGYPPLSQTLAWDSTVWGRRSIFFIGGWPLLLSEVFLPVFQNYLESAQ